VNHASSRMPSTITAVGDLGRNPYFRTANALAALTGTK